MMSHKFIDNTNKRGGMWIYPHIHVVIIISISTTNLLSIPGQAIAGAASAAPFTPATTIGSDLGIQCSTNTIRRRLHSAGRNGRRPAIKPKLTEANMEQRMEYALEYADKPTRFWEQVIYCDEKTFSSDGQTAARYVWRPPNTR